MTRGPGASTVEMVDGITKIPREAWNSVLTPEDSPFLEWDWLRAMEESRSAAPNTGWAPYHMIVRAGGDRAGGDRAGGDGDGALLAACPVYLKTHSMGEFVFDHGWAEAAERAGIRYYPKLLVGVPFTPHSGRRFLTAPGADREPLVSLLAQALVALCMENELSSVHVNFCELDEAASLRESGFIERLGYQYHWRNPGFRGFDDYLNQLKSKRRHAVRHERAELQRQGVTIRVHAGDDIPDSLFGPMFQLYRTTTDKLYWGRQYLTKKFFDLMRDSFKRHICLVCAFKGGELIAGTFNVQKAGVLYGRYWGSFKELKYLHFNVCYYAAIEHCIAAGLTRFEPGAGGEYKWLRGFDPALTRSAHFIVHPGLRKAVAASLARERREVEAWIAAGREHSQLKAPPPSDAEQA